MTCKIPDLVAGRHSIKLASDLGGIIFSPTSIESKLSASSLSPTSGGNFGGQLITLTGFGFTEDAVIEIKQEGNLICEFCHIHSIPTSSKLIFYSPRVTNTAPLSIQVKHEFIETSIEPLEFLLTEVDAKLTSIDTDGDINSLYGGESMKVYGENLGNCEDLSLEVIKIGDPCAAGMHECHPTLAKCTPTSDMLDYTCACKPFDEWEYDCNQWCQLYRENRNGRQCDEVHSRGTVRVRRSLTPGYSLLQYNCFESFYSQFLKSVKPK